MHLFTILWLQGALWHVLQGCQRQSLLILGRLKVTKWQTILAKECLNRWDASRAHLIYGRVSFKRLCILIRIACRNFSALLTQILSLDTMTSQDQLLNQWMCAWTSLVFWSSYVYWRRYLLNDAGKCALDLRYLMKDCLIITICCRLRSLCLTRFVTKKTSMKLEAPANDLQLGDLLLAAIQTST